MKIKHGLTLTLILAPVCTLIRVLQYLFAIDSNGYYTSGTLSTVLEYSLYGALALTALISLLLMLKKDKSKCDFKHALFSKPAGILFTLIGILTVYLGGYALGSSLADNKFDYVGALGILAAIGYALLGFGILRKKQYKLSALFCIFPPVYLLAEAISEFFGSFKHISLSSNKISMLTVCVCALYVMSVCAVQSGASVTLKRLAAVSMLAAVMCMTHALPQLIFEFSLALLPRLVSELALAFCAVITLIRLCAPLPAAPEPEPEQPIEDIMNKYLNEIPDEETEDNE